MGLLDFLKKIPTLNEISGGFGEWMAKTYSKTIPGALVLHDVLIDGADGYTSQIDLVLVGNRGVYKHAELQRNYWSCFFQYQHIYIKSQLFYYILYHWKIM